jgi:hypothetical protein
MEEKGTSAKSVPFHEESIIHTPSVHLVGHNSLAWLSPAAPEAGETGSCWQLLDQLGNMFVTELREILWADSNPHNFTLSALQIKSTVLHWPPIALGIRI